MTLPLPRPHRVSPVCVSAYTATTATGVGVTSLREALDAHRSGLVPNDFSHQPLPTWIGRVPAIEAATLPPELASWDCRNNRLAWLGLQADDFLEAARAARERYGAQRIALVIGTSTSSIGE
jgi:3-oxoacyl-[acyl-carrier-protein] synthase-1